MQTIRPWTIGSPTELFATRIVTAEANAAAGCDCGRARVHETLAIGPAFPVLQNVPID